MRPKIRLKGFSKEWENTSFKEIVKVNSGKDYKHLTEGDIPVYGTGGYMLSVNDSLSDKDGIGIGRKGTIDKPQLLKAPFWTVDTLFFMVPNEKIDLNFLFAVSERTQWKKYDESTGVPSLSKQNIENISLAIPDKIEQQRIAEYFKNLDSLIEATTKKIETLKQTKLACLQSMFPQPGEGKPRLRFKEYDDNWDVLPLSTFARKSTEKNTALEYNITLTNSAEYGVINQLDFFDHDISNDSHIDRYYVIHNDDFVYNPRVSTFAPVGPINRNTLGYSGVMSPLYLIFKVDDINKDFLAYFFKTTLWHQYMKLEGNTGARFDRLALSDSQFFNMPIYVPKQVKEQEDIASFFSNLDKQISLYEHRLEKLTNIKSACLDGMFI